MKQYIWIASLIAVTGAGAAENPFDLNVNLQKIEQSEKLLLNDLENLPPEQIKESRTPVSDSVQKKQKRAFAVKPETPAAEKKMPAEVSPSVKIETAEEKAARLRQAREAKERELLAQKKAASEKAAAEKKAREAAREARIRQAKMQQEAAAKQKKRETNISSLKGSRGEGESSSIHQEFADINISREKEMQAIAAQAELEAAIREVDRE